MVKCIIRNKALPKRMKKKKLIKLNKQITNIERQYQEVLNDPLLNVYDNILDKFIEKNLVNLD